MTTENPNTNPELTPAEVIDILETNTIELEPLEQLPEQTQQEVAQDFYQLLTELEVLKAEAKDKAEAKRLRVKIRATKAKLGIPLAKAPAPKAKKGKANKNPQAALLTQIKQYQEQLTEAELLIEVQAGQLVFLGTRLTELLQQTKTITKAQVKEILTQVEQLPTPTIETE
jgi:hypothetical protein